MRIPEVFFGALLAVAVFAFGFLVASSLIPRDQQETDQGNNAAPKKSEKIIKSESADDRIATYTLWLAVLTGGLVVVSGIQGYFLLRADKTAKISADAAKLNAESLIDAERAHLYVVVETHNLYDALYAALEYWNDKTVNETAIGNKPSLEFTIRNLGRSPAILKEVGYQIIQGQRNQKQFQYVVCGIMTPVIEGGQESKPSTKCDLDTLLTVSDAKDAIAGIRPLYFYGHVRFATSFGREYEYWFRYENLSRQWRLAYYDEKQRGKSTEII